MALPVIPISAETQEQANPAAYGMSAMNQALQSGITNAYLPSSLAAMVLHANLINQQLAPQAALAPQMAQAELQQAQMQAPYLGSQIAGIYQGQIPQQQGLAGYYGSMGNQINTLLPYAKQQEQGKIFSDPILSRLYQLNLANKTGAIPTPYVSGAGLPTPGMPNLNNSINTARQNPENQQMSPGNVLPPNAFGNNPVINPVTAPKLFNGDSFQNWALFGNPYNPFTISQLQKQAEETGKSTPDQWNNTFNEAQDHSDNTYDLIDNLKKFQNAYDASTYKGPTLGTTPTSGWKTALIPGKLSNEQAADNASKNIVAALAKTTIGGRVSGYELGFIQDLKPNRAMTPQTAKESVDFFMGRAQQIQQFPQFLNSAQNQGIDLRTAQNLWNMYREQRPVYNFQTKTPYKQFNGTWRDYLSDPQAIQAAQNGTPYVKVPDFNGNKKAMGQWLQTLNPDDKAWVIQQYRGNQNK